MAYGWPAYVVSGILALTLSGVMTGCRFGNHVESSKAQTDDPFVMEYWNTAPQTLMFCAQVPGNAYCRQANTNYIPGETSLVMSDPVIMYTKDPKHELWYFVNKAGYTTPYIPFLLAADNSIALDASGTDHVLSDSCAAPFVVKIDQARRVPYASPLPGQDGISQIGRVQMRISWTTDYSSSGCRQVLKTASDCYNDVNLCAGADLTAKNQQRQLVADRFGQYFVDGNGNGLPPSQLENLTQESYEVIYQ
jgi:hypothetical protein